MRRVGQTRRRDANEQAIVEALEAVGAHVTRISGKGAPDVLCRFRGQIYAFEVKGPTGKLTKAQRETRWEVVRSAEEALVAIGAIR